MKNKNLFKVITVLILFISTLLFTPSISQASKSKTSYLQNTKKIYVYRFGGKNSNRLTATYYGKSKDKSLKGYNIWDERYEGEEAGIGAYYEKETKKGLYNPDGKVISYPTKKGKTWKNKYGKLTIISVKKTVKVPAGTFKNVVKIKFDDGENIIYRYYAKDVGFILGVKDGKRTTELLKLKKKKK